MTVRIVRTGILFLIFSLNLAVRQARAVGMHLYGADSESSALAGAMAGWASEASAAYFNPAGLAFGETDTLKFGYVTSTDRLRLAPIGTNPSLATADPYYTQRNESMIRKGAIIAERAAFDFGFSFKFWRFGFGFDTYTPQHTLLDEKFLLLQQPYFFELSNAPEHVSAIAGLGYKILDNLSIGAGASLALDVDGRLPLRIPLELNATNDPTIINHAEGEVSLDLKIRAAFGNLYSLMYQPIKPLKLGLVYREKISIEAILRADLVAFIFGQKLVVPIEVFTPNHFEPEQWVLGASYAFSNLVLMGEGSYNIWSDYVPPYSQVSVVNPDRLAPPQFPVVTNAHLRNTADIRLGAEWTVSEQWKARGGYRFKESPVPPQHGDTNIIDGHKHFLSAGFGYSPFKFLRFDGVVQYLYMESTRDTKFDDELIDNDEKKAGHQIYNPLYPGFKASGSVVSFGMTATMRFHTKLAE